MIYILLLLLSESDSEELIEAFNTMDRERKKIILDALRKLYVEEFNQEITIYKRIYQEYEDKRVELAILHEFGLEQGFINEATSFFNDIDLQIDTNFENVNSIEDLT